MSCFHMPIHNYVCMQGFMTYQVTNFLLCFKNQPGYCQNLGVCGWVCCIQCQQGEGLSQPLQCSFSGTPLIKQGPLLLDEAGVINIPLSVTRLQRHRCCHLQVQLSTLILQQCKQSEKHTQGDMQTRKTHL